MENQDLSWVAGFMDGEGTITIKRYNRYKGQSLRYQAYISCTQSQAMYNIRAIESLKEYFGGSLTRYKQPKGLQSRPTIQWVITSKTAYSVAKMLLPYLRIKQEQARLLIKFQESMTLMSGRKRLPEEEIEKRDKLWFEMRKLNVKGKLHLQRLNEVTPASEM